MIRKAKRNATPGVTHYYVPSDSDPNVEYMVVEIEGDGKTTRLCNCRDFFGRRIAFLGTPAGECKHTLRVVQFIEEEKA